MISKLHVSGKYIKDAQGKVVLLRGVTKGGFVDNDWTGWWVPVGQVWGHGFRTWNTDAARANLQAMKDRGCNILRIITTIDWWLSDYNSYRENIKSVIEIAADIGIYIIFCPFSVKVMNPSGYVNLPFPPYMPVDYESIIPNKQAFINYLVGVANELKGYDNVMFDLWNEPHDLVWGTEAQREEWLDAAQSCINAIRVVTNQIIIVQWGYGLGASDGVHWSPDLYSMQWVADHPMTGGNIVYSTHIYRSGGQLGGDKPYDYDTIKQRLINCKVNYVQDVLNHPVLIGELGMSNFNDVANEREAFRNILTILNEWGIGYLGQEWFVENREFALLQNTNYIPPPNAAGQILIDAIAAGQPTPIPPTILFTELALSLTPVWVTGVVVAAQELKRIGVIP